MFRIGEFSKLAMVSVRMLRHYDEIGLLIPQKVDEETGYRYYSAQQLAKIGQIQMLRQMGISLQNIGEMIAVLEQPQEMEQVLQRRKSQLEQQRQTVEEQLSLVQSAINRLREEQTMNQYHVEKKVFPSMQVAALRKVIPSYEREGDLWEEMYQTLAQEGLMEKMPGKCCSIAVFYDEKYKEQDVDVEIRSEVTEKFEDCKNVFYKTVPQVTAATVMMNGGYEQVGQVYAEIARWLEEHHYVMEGPMFHIYHVSPAMDQNPDNWVTEVCVPLQVK